MTIEPGREALAACAATRAVLVNGERRYVRAETVAALLDELGLPGGTVATAVNEVFVGRARRTACRLSDGDSVTVFRPVVGG